MNLTWLFVGVLYALAIAFTKVPRRIALLFYVLVLLFLWRPLTQDVIMIPADVIRLTPPWSEMRAPGRDPVTKYEVSNLNLHDVPMQIVPWWRQVRESWRAFEAPLWNDANGCGYPLLANGQTTPLSPLRVLTQPLSLARAMAAEAAMKLLLALVLTYLFCRRRYSVPASILAAIAFGFSTWMTTWLQFPIAAAAAFLPGVLLCIDLLLEEVTRRRVIGAALMFAATVLSGHPETVYHVGLIAAAYGLWVGWPRGLAAVALSSLLAVFIASPFLVPFAEAVVRSQRFSEMRAPRESLIPPYSDVQSAVLLLQPRFYGHLPIERPWGPTTLESICGFAGVLSLVAVIAAAITIVVQRRWRERETLYVLGFLFSLAVVLGWPLVTPLFHAVAGLAPTMRMRLGLCWFGALLIAAVVDWARPSHVIPSVERGIWAGGDTQRLPSHPGPSLDARDDRRFLLVGALIVAATMLLLLQTTEFPTSTHRTTAVLSLFPSLAVLLAVLLAVVWPRLSVWVLPVLTTAELWLAIAHWNPVLPPREMYRPTPLVTALQQLGAKEQVPFRIVGTGGQLYPNLSAMYGLEDVRVHDPMAYGRYVDLLAQTVGWNPLDYYAKWNDVSTPLLDFLNVKYVVADRELTDPVYGTRYRPLYAGRDGRIYENTTVLPRFYAVRNVLAGGDPRTHTDWRYTALVSRLPRNLHAQLTAPWTGEDATVTIRREAADRYTLHVQTARPTLIVSSIAHWPGWRTGFPQLEVNGAFLGFVVPAGEHEIEVAYRPLSFYVTGVFSLLTLATLPVLWRKRPPDRPQ
ncbi:MAG TPA: hypothetical protein VEK57_14570 [Thermoanaerobaculia bacterium]|nr:hypothetical protein [Thermoanaerobaculia bacterium]